MIGSEGIGASEREKELGLEKQWDCDDWASSAAAQLGESAAAR